MEVVPGAGHVELMLVFAMEKGRGDGTGTGAMRFLCALADRHGVQILLHPKRVGKEGIPTNKLPAFYRRFGFTGAGRQTMVRQPNKETK